MTLACLAAVAGVGLVATIHAFVSAGAAPMPPPTVMAATPIVIAATIWNLAIRFVRWQFLLRRLGARLPTIPSLGAFVGSFAFLPVPLCVGQLIARVRLVPLESAQVPRVVLAFGWEQALSVWALSLYATAALGPTVCAVSVAASSLLLIGPVRRGIARLITWVTGPAVNLLVTGPARTGTADDPGAVTLAMAAALSLLAWGPVVVTILPLVWLAGTPVGALDGITAAARSILAGAASLVPLGASVAGRELIASLERLGAEPVVAAQVVFAYRAATAWLSVALGGIALLALGRERRHGHAHDHDHFDAIDACYDAWLPPHYRDHLVDRKTTPVIARLPALGVAPRGLDIGCGRGWYADRLVAAGARMTGLDMSARQLAAAREYVRAPMPLVQGTALALPFRSNAFEFAYVINVLHHVASPPAQRDALAEIGRVVRPGGLVFVHEMSVRNPLFRLYLEYVYPVVKGIEEGTEYYLDPRHMTDAPGLRLIDVRCFTFIPDFVPRPMLPWLAPLERRLEAGPAAAWAAHFLAVYERVAP